ncbi:asparagine synthase (glutamine-hydrolyzing) [Neptuniibacter sp. QD48_55]|uniref:asparagine synthase (glutamine-hydrolyzing) n=1 Tax=Neptuniibacter sp. QD48_55 TaxID=3398212 RepID=UPI0039F52407
MCGIAGLISNSCSFDGSALQVRGEAFADLLSRRGGDGTGTRIIDGNLFVHTRLAVQDLSSAGAQPMVDPTGRFTLVYNGEIYNAPQLRSIASAQGYSFLGTSDTEALLAVFSLFGAACISKIEGTFAFAIYDKLHKKTYLVRDRLGVKPLYFASSLDAFFFCSEISPLAVQLKHKSINQQSLLEYLWFGSVTGENSFYAEINAVPPGSVVTVSPDNQITVAKWWELEEWLVSEKYKSISSSQKRSCSLNSAISEAVSRQLVSDLPLSVFLSSGVDSSILAAECAKNNKDILAVTARFSANSVQDESVLASKMAKSLGLRHHVLDIDNNQVESDISELLCSFGEPFGDAAAIPLYQMCKQLRANGNKVVLQGDGGDELFWGYNRYCLVNPLIRTVLSAGSLVLKKHNSDYFGKGDRVNRMLRAFNSVEPAELFPLLLTRESKHGNVEQLFSSDYVQGFSAELDPFSAYRKTNERFSNVSNLSDRLRLVDLCIQLPTQFLPKVDRASMAANVEARVPLLDEIVVKHALQYKSPTFMMPSDSKKILKKAYSNALPEAVKKQRKLGFTTPYSEWLDGQLKNSFTEMCLDPAFSRYFNFSAVFLESIVRGDDHSRWSYQFMRWKLFMLAKWFFEGGQIER